MTTLIDAFRNFANAPKTTEIRFNKMLIFRFGKLNRLRIVTSQAMICIENTKFQVFEMRLSKFYTTHAIRLLRILATGLRHSLTKPYRSHGN